MSNKEISELTGKSISHVHRDIINILCELYDIQKNDPDLDDKLKQYVISV